MLIEIIVITAVLEIITCIGRFGLKMRARDWKWPVRIHHGYVGLVLVLLWLVIPQEWLLIIGLSLVVSDAIHHFVVLPLTVKSTEFP